MVKPLLPLLILFLCLAAVAQDSTLVCPTIKISEPDQRDIFFAHAELAVQVSGGFQLTGYEWNISRGDITEGTGTERIKIAFLRDDDGARFDAEVRVRGLPEGCEERAKISFNVDLNPGTLDMLDEFADLPDNDLRLRLDAAVMQLKDHPEFVLYFIIYNEPGREKQFEKFRDKIENHLSKDPLYDSQNIKILRGGENRLSVQIYLWPEGEAPPVISANCPEFTVYGPAGIPRPNEPFVYTATIDAELPKSAKLVWSVSKGQIIEGWGTDRISVVLAKEDFIGGSIRTDLKIEGVPSGCPDLFTETLPIDCDFPEPVLIDEISDVPVAGIARERLADAIREGAKNPTNQLYIIEYFPPWTSEFDVREKIERIRRYIADELKFDLSFVTIVTAEGKALHTKIYRVPPGAENPAP